MGIIEQAARRLEELQRAGVSVPWAAAGFSDPPVEADRGPAGLAPVAPAVVGGVQANPAAARAADDGRQSRYVEIDLQRLAREGYVVPGGARNVTADEFRVIKRPLLKNAMLTGAAAMHRGNLVQVTSAVPGEGKTFTAINLALSLSMEVDHSVLLADADVIRPAVLQRLGIPTGPGLIELLRDPHLDPAEVMFRTNVPKLSILPAGAADLNSTELLASGAMDRLLDQLSSRYPDRIVVFDSAPLLAATESRVLATRVGQVVVVVESGSTSRDLINEAFAALSNCPVVMAVLNKYQGPATTGTYGY